MQATTSDPHLRLRAILDREFQFVWRTLRRLGVDPSSVDDAAQKVFLVFAERLASIELGKERSFLFGCARRVASDMRREARTARWAPEEEGLSAPHPGPSTDELVDRKRARDLLDELLDRMPDEQRAVFLLYEGEGLTTGEIAELLEIPVGTVASRLRLSRAKFEQLIAPLRERAGALGGAS